MSTAMFTIEDEVEAGEAGELGFSGLWSPDLGALHPHQG